MMKRQLNRVLTKGIMLIGALGIALSINDSNSTAQAKSTPSISVTSSKGHKIKLPYASKQTRTIGKSTQLDQYIDDVTIKVKSVTSYKLKPNKYGKKTVVRLNILAKSTGANHDDYAMFTSSAWRGKAGYLSTNNGYRLTQAVNTHPSPADFPVTLSDKDARALNLNFTSKSNLSLNEVSHGIVHFYYSVGGAALAQHFSY